MKQNDKFKSNITENFYKDLKKIVSIFYFQTIFNLKERMLLPINSIQNLPKDSHYKNCFNENPDYEDIYGAFFDYFEEFCNGELDLKNFTKKKELENYQIIKNAITTYYTSLKFEEKKSKQGMYIHSHSNINKNKDFYNFNKQDFHYVSILEGSNELFEDIEDNQEAKEFVQSAKNFNKQLSDEKPRLINRPVYQNTSILHNSNEKEVGENNFPVNATKYLIGEDLYEVDLLIKMCEEDKTEKFNTSLKQKIEDENKLQENYLLSVRKSDNDKLKNDLHQLLNNQKHENEGNIKNLTNSNIKTAARTPEFDKLNPFKLNETNLLNQKELLNSIKKSPVSEMRALDFGNIHKTPTPTKAKIFSPNPNLNYSIFDASKVKANLFKEIKKD